MSDLPKLLAPIETTDDLDFSWNEGGTPVTVALTAGTWDSILELVSDLSDACEYETGGTVAFTVSSNGFVTYTVTGVTPTTNWGSCDADLLAILGYAGTESFSSNDLVATDRHLYGWYSPVGVDYPGFRRTKTRRVQRNDAGGVFVMGSSAVHKDLDLRFEPLLEAQIEPGAATTESDGKGGSVDWTSRTLFDFWEYAATLRWRFYEDGSLGTVADPGTEGTDYHTCVFASDEVQAEQIDPDGYTWFAVSLPVHIDTENV